MTSVAALYNMHSKLHTMVTHVLQDSGIDDDVMVMTEERDDLMDDDEVVLPDAHQASVSH